MSLSRHARAEAENPKEFRIGYQKNGVLVIARQQDALEKRFAKVGVAIKWVEFSAGPPMMEAMNAGSVDFGQVGDSPPIFAQAAGANIVYVAGQPITNGQGILVKQDSEIRTLADLKGKRIALGKGTSAHNVTIMALENAGLQFGDITPVYLNPPEGASAFARGSVDAWAVWDPYFSIGEPRAAAACWPRRSSSARPTRSISPTRFRVAHGAFLRDAIAALAQVADWAEANRDQVGKSLAEVTGVDLEIQTFAARRSSFAIGRIDDGIVTTQQAVADRFHKLGSDPETRRRPRRGVDAAAVVNGGDGRTLLRNEGVIPCLASTPCIPSRPSQAELRSLSRPRRCRCRRKPPDKVVRIGYQKYGTLILLKGKGILEKKLDAARRQGDLDRIPVRPAAARSDQCRRHRLRQHRRSAADLRPGRRRTARLRRARAARAAGRSDPGARRTARSRRSPTSRARRSR